MLRLLNRQKTFLGEVRRNFHTTGALVPSSVWLARALARYVDAEGPSRRVLEAGPGTGSVTRSIIARLRDNDELDLVELNQRFVEALRHRFEAEDEFRSVASRARVLHERVENVGGQHAYDLIISGLPLNNFQAADVERIMAAFARLLKRGGILSFFEYVGVRRLRGTIGGHADRQRLSGIGRVLERVFAQHEIRRDLVLVNIPPAWVHHVQFERPAFCGNTRAIKVE